MLIEAFQFIAILLTSLSMSVHFGTWLTEKPICETQSGKLFVEVHKGRDDTAAKVMPILGNASSLSIAIATVLMRADLAPFILAAAALVLVIANMVVTLRYNVPINKEVQSWTMDAIPENWSTLRDRWERFHTIRTWLIVAGFALFTAAVVLF